MDLSKDRTFLQSLQSRRDSLQPFEKEILENHSFRGVSIFITKKLRGKGYFARDIVKRYGDETLKLMEDKTVGEISVEIAADFNSFRNWLNRTYLSN